MQRTAKLIQFKSTGDLAVRIDFPYSNQDVARMHRLDGRKYHGDQKCWTCPITTENLNKLVEWQFSMDPRFDQYRHKPVREKIKRAPEIKGLKKKLYGYQETGVGFIEDTGGRTLLADEMGLGKTVQALAWLQMHPELRPAVVVCPASAKYVWARETIDWMSDSDHLVLQGKAPTKLDAWKDIMIINYDILPSWYQILKNLKPKALILDECHYIKNNKAKRTKAVKMLAKGIPHVICTSGTPIVNRPIEIYNAVRILDPMLLPEQWVFGKKYCGLKHNGFGWDWTGATNTKELHELLTDSVMIRRLKKNVLPDLPPKTRSFIPMELDNWMDYYNAESNFLDYLRRKKGERAAEQAEKASHLVQIEQLKQLAVHGKIKQVEGWIEDFLQSDQKLVVFCIHQNIIDRLMEKFKRFKLPSDHLAKAVKIDGRDSDTNRQKSVDSFQNDPSVRLLIGNIKAAGVAITLTAATNVAIVELPWTPGELVQAEDRCHRIGTKGNVTVHFLLARDSIEEKLARILDDKAEVITAVLDGKDVPQESMLTELMNQYL